MRHVSRTHRVVLDWLFDRINLDTKNQIWYIDTKHQLADILTKGIFTRDEWKNLLHLFNISHFSSTCCSNNSSLISCLPKDGDEGAGMEGRRKFCGKIKTYSFELAFICSGKFLIREKSDYILRSGETHGCRETCKQDEKKFETWNLTKRRVLKWSWKMYTLAGWWMKARRNLSQQRRVRYYGNFLNLNPGAFTRMK